MLKFYDYQHDGDVIICGDYNSRCCDESDHIEGVDNIPQREVLDYKLNHMGHVARKPVFGVSDKVSFKPVSSATETS